jgi:YHS domain-containing protein
MESPNGFFVAQADYEAWWLDKPLTPTLSPSEGERGKANASAGAILAFAVPASIVTATCGWLLSLGGGYEDRLLQWHKWTGIAVAAMCALLGLVYWLDRKKLYRAGLLATFAVLLWASHYGGSLTHGSDYLSRYAPEPLRSLLAGGSKPAPAQNATVPLTEKRAFADVIQPVLAKNCVTCHGPEKAKAGLHLDTLRGVLKGSEHGPVVVAGKAAASEMIKRLTLPTSNEDHMPPEGKPQPSADDIALLKWWVDAGAPEDKKIAQLSVSPAIHQVLERRFADALAGAGKVAPVLQPKPLAEVLPLAEKITDDLNIAVSGLSPTEPWLQCNASIAGTNFADADLAALAPLATNLRWLDLAGTAVTDAALEQVGAMRHLTRLHLQRTAITDAGISQLAGLGELEALNLYGTAVTDDALETLKRLPKLRQLYLWQSKVTPEAAKAFAEARVDKDQIAKWEAEIEQLQADIRDQHMSVDVGAPETAAAEPGPIPINTLCPVSGKLAERTKTTVHEGKLVAFCCDDCKASFAKDPKAYEAKLAQFANPPPGNLGLAKAINAKCPVSGKDVDPAKTSMRDGKVLAFCCGDCKAKFDQDPTPYLAKLGLSTPISAPPRDQKQ